MIFDTVYLSPHSPLLVSPKCVLWFPMYNSKIKFYRYLSSYQVLETVQGLRGAENEIMSVPRLLNLVEKIYEQIACAVLEM